jgi:hypothetical protein
MERHTRTQWTVSDGYDTFVTSCEKVSVPFQVTVELISNQIEANVENDKFLSEQTERLDEWLKEALGENVDEQSEAVRKA